MKPLLRERIFLDSQYTLHESGFGDAEYRAIFRSTDETYCSPHSYGTLHFGYVPIACTGMFWFLMSQWLSHISV